MFTKRKLKTIFLNALSTSMLLVLAALFCFSSCMQKVSNVRKSIINSSSTNTNSSTPTKIPVFTEGSNFIQNGGVVYTSQVAFDLSFVDTLQLRGKDVDTYIRSVGTQTIACLTGRFTDSSIKQVNLIAAMPHSVYNFTTQTLEYYYSIAPSDETNNQNFCQKSGLINKLFSLYPTLTATYKLSSLCPSSSCPSTIYTSQPLELYTQSGSALTQISTKQLSYAISNKITTTTPIGNTCVSNTECISQGFDCCSLGQCVKDLAVKPGVDTASTNYVQALQDILNSPSHIYLYPQYYFICSNPVNTPTVPTTPGPPISTAIARLKALSDLYSCTTKIEGELGFCTKTISNPIINSIYSAEVDDRNFSSTYTNQSNSGYSPTQKDDLISIQEVTYGEVTLFNYDQITIDSSVRPDPYVVSSYLTLNGHHNDDNTTGTAIKLTAKPTTAVSTDLVIKYKIDASCVQQSTSVAKCEKYYIQGQQKSGDTIAKNRLGRVTDHYPASNFFKLPYYANTNKNIIVEVDGLTQKRDIDWQLTTSSPISIQFLPTSTGGMRVTDTQKVKITYFTDLSVYHVMDSKLAALTKIKDNCHCADLNCSLKPILDTTDKIVDYSCVYPDPNPIVPPVSQIVYLSSKNVPVRYFDAIGTSKSTVTGDTLPQEGKAFSYRNDNLLNPSNMPDINNPVAGEDTYTGFNEIYGSLTYGTNSAKPAKEVSVTKGKTYDIYVDNGAYSNCIQCGNDYYSQLNKLFPLTSFAGGLVPLQARTDRTLGSGIPADDFSFGRACFVPATMLPFSHSISSDSQDQRKNRMRAQHFFYANGYQHDWFGFDYGAVIGSFDGVKWFAIGTNRRIKADTNKLFIAVNGPFGDLTLESTYTVTINDGALNPIGSNMVSSDAESDGAQCQKFHQCSTDNDCATTLGWDYVCSDVTQSTSSWPKFDDNAKEIPDSQRDDLRLISILNLSASGKRCVYRGRGSACTQNYLESVLDASSSKFNDSINQSVHTCSSNNYCQNIANGGTLISKFNNRIARYAKVRVDSSSDSFGLGTKVPGRPMEFNALEQVRSETAKSLNENKVAGICIPGRTPEVDTYILQNATVPPSVYSGDKVLNIGMSKNSDASSPDYLASCAVLDNNKNYFYAKSSTPNSSNLLPANIGIIYNSGTQSISTNALKVFDALFVAKGFSPSNLLKNNSTPLTAVSFTENRCMRAPGASCFSDIECAPSKVITDKLKQLTVPDNAFLTIMNQYEIKFWQEDLICSQATSKSDANYSSFNNRCCRDVGKTISLPSADLNLPLKMTSVPGIDVKISDPLRYSRVSTLYKDQILDPTNFPALNVATVNQCTTGTCKPITMSSITPQYKTFSAFAERTSCTGDWVRSFSDGKHIWNKSRFQTFDTGLFRCFNWTPGTNQWNCSGEIGDPNCKLVQTFPLSGKGKAVMNFLAKLELTGIPQIAIESEEYYNDTSEGDMSCLSNPDDQSLPYGAPNFLPPNKLFAAGAVGEYRDTDTGTKKVYSALDEKNFQGMNKIFKADEVVSCLAAGTLMSVGADPSQCCTGFINPETNRCQLNDFVDISVYTNRYVSSEAKKLNSASFDSNGYINDPEKAMMLACEKNMCASGKVAYGLLISYLKTPGNETKSDKSYRFLQNTPNSDDFNGLLSIYKAGLKLNNHAYCYPKKGATGEDIKITTCGN